MEQVNFNLTSFRELFRATIEQHCVFQWSRLEGGQQLMEWIPLESEKN